MKVQGLPLSPNYPIDIDYYEYRRDTQKPKVLICGNPSKEQFM